MAVYTIEFTPSGEARAVAALNHPHVCTLYDIGPNYLVMELVEGETLATRLGKGALTHLNGSIDGWGSLYRRESGK